MRAIGKVKWFNSTKGYGFIEQDNGKKDVFIHISAVQNSNLEKLENNQRIEYDIVTKKGRESAENISLI